MFNLKFSKILITGGTGFIGSHLAEKLLEYENISIVIVDNQFSCNVLPKNIENKIRLEKKDVRNLDDMEELFKEIQPEICFHLAAIHFIPYCIKHTNETIDVNIRGSANIQHLCSKYSCNLIQASTADVYTQEKGIHSEESIVKPMNIYGYSKRAAEETLEFFFCEYPELFGVSVRIFNVYGERDTIPHVITEIINQLKEQESREFLSLELGNTEPKRDFIHASDVADGLISIANKIDSGIYIYNLGSGESWSIREIISEIEKILQKKINVEISTERFRKSDRMNLQADISKIKNEIGWEPKISINKGLEQLIKNELKI